MRYVNLDIELREEAGGYRLVLTPPPGGGDPCSVDVAPLHAAFAADLERLRRDDGDAAYYRDLGGRLFAALFGGAGGAVLDGLIRRQRDQGGGVCLRLRLGGHARALPWEFMFRADWNAYVGAAIESPLVRFLDTPKPIAEFCVRLPLRMLVLAPAAGWRAAGTGPDAQEDRRLDARAEIGDLRKLAGELAGALELTVLENDVSFDRVCELLLEQNFEVVHFIGHGSFNGEFARLQFDREGGGEEPVDEGRLAQLFSNLPAVKLVFLNACESAAVANLDAVHGLAPRLVQQGVPAVVAMQYEIQDAAAIGFARAFYHSLFRGSERGRVDVATNLARSRLAGEYADQREFAAPVLYTRVPAGVLFDAPGPRARSLLIWPADAGRVLAVEQTLASNLEKNAANEGPASDPSESTAEPTSAPAPGSAPGSAPAHRAQAAADALALARLRRMRRRSNLLTLLTLATLILVLALEPRWLAWVDAKTQTAILGMRDWLFPLRLHPNLRLVEIDTDTVKRFDKTWPGVAWRADHARLIERLSAAGARTIAFNLNLKGEGKSGDDAALEAAIRAAQARGTAVVFGPSNEDPANKADPDMRTAFFEAGALWGTACMFRQDFGYAIGVPLAAQPADGAMPPRPALALVAAFPDHAITRIDPSDLALRLSRPGDPTPLAVPFSELNREPVNNKGCSLVRAQWRVAFRFVAFPARERWRERTEPYHQVAHPDTRPDLRRYKDATVVVAAVPKVASENSRIPVLRWEGEEEIGAAAFHATLINGLWDGRARASLPAEVPGLPLAAFGAAWRLLGPGGRRRMAGPGQAAGAVLLTSGLAILSAFAIVVWFDRYFNVGHTIAMGLLGYLGACALHIFWVAPAPGSAGALPGERQ
jgi:hypothetical protein